MQLLLKILMSIGMKLLTSDAILDMLLFVLEKGAEASKVKWDDELVVIVKKHLEEK